MVVGRGQCNQPIFRALSIFFLLNMSEDSCAASEYAEGGEYGADDSVDDGGNDEETDDMEKTSIINDAEHCGEQWMIIKNNTVNVHYEESPPHPLLLHPTLCCLPPSAAWGSCSRCGCM